jgi:autotransporter-associated beta strand protein
VSRIQAAGRINVSSGGGKGGRVKLEGEDIELESTAEVDASGATGGGDVLVGGDWQGGANEARRVLDSPDAMTTAERVDVAAGANINVSAIQQGDGGTAVVWADDYTYFAGHIASRGGRYGGDGGQTEVSGKAVLDYRGVADLTAPLGQTGELLLDPTDLVISNASSNNRDADFQSDPRRFEPDGFNTQSVLNVEELVNQLAMANVTVSTVGSRAVSGQTGQITVASKIDAGATNNLLKLEAAGDIRFDADVVSDGDLQLWADADGAVIQGGGHHLGTSVSPLKDVRLSAAGQTTGGVGIRTDNVHANHLELETLFADVEQNANSGLDVNEVVLTGFNQAAFNLDEDNRIGKFAGQVVGGDVTLRNTIDLVVDNTLTTNIGRNSLRPALRTFGGNVTIEGTQNVSGVHINTRSSESDASSAAGDITIRLTADDADMSLGGAAGSARTTIYGGLDHIKAENGTTTFSTTGNNSDLLVGGFSASESAEMGDIVLSASRDLLFQGGDSDLSGGTITLKAGRDIKFSKNLSATTVVAEAKTAYLEEAGISAASLSFHGDLAITLPDYGDSDTPADVDLSTTDNAHPYVDLRGTLTVDAPKSAVRIQARNASGSSSDITLGDVDADNLALNLASGNGVSQADSTRLRTRELILLGSGGGAGFELTGDNVIDDLAGDTQGAVEVLHDATVSGQGSGLVIKPLTGGVSGVTYRGLTTNDNDFAITTEKNFSFATHLNETLLDAGAGTVTIKDGTGATADGIALGKDNRTNLSIGGGLAQITAAKTVFDTRDSGNPIYVNGVNHTGLGAVTFLSGGTLDFIGNTDNPTVVHGDLTAETPGLLTVLEDIESKGSMRLSANSIFLGENNLITLAATGTGSDLTLDAPVTWDTRELRIKAGRDIRLEGMVDGRPSGSGATDGSLSLRYGLASTDGVENGRDARLRIHAPVRLPAGSNFSEKIGSGGNLDDYTVITTLGSAGSTSATDLQGMAGSLDRNYALGSDIDASTTASWNGGKGFDPIGDRSTGFDGNFHGLGNWITGLTIDRPDEDYVGLFGYLGSNNRLSHLSLADIAVAGRKEVAGLAGEAQGRFVNGTKLVPKISDIRVSGRVSGDINVAGLVGVNQGFISRVTADGAVENSESQASKFNHAGIVGLHLSDGVLEDSFSTVRVSGDFDVGGIVGHNSEGTIKNVYSVGRVDGTNRVGLVAGSTQDGTITNAFGRDVAAPYSQSTYGTKSGGTWSGFDFDDTWTMVDGETRPLLRSERSSRISNARQLQLMRVAPTRAYMLANHIDLTEQIRANKGLWRDGLVPAGDTAAQGAFTGTLNGSFKTITGLFVNRDDDLTDGLLGEVNGGSVSNLTLNDVNLTSGDGQGSDDGNLTLGSGVTLTGNVNLNAGTGNVSVSNAIGTTGNLAKAVSITGADLNLPAVRTENAQTYTASSVITAADDLVSNGAPIEFDGDVLLPASIVVDTTNLANANGGTIAFKGTVNGDNSTARDLFILSGQGALRFHDAVGQTQALRQVYVDQASMVTADKAFEVQELAVRASGDITFNDSGNDIDRLALELNGAGNGSVVDQDALELATLSSGLLSISGLSANDASNDFTLGLGGALTQAAGATITTPGTLAIDTTAFDAADVTLRNDALGGTVLGDTLIAGTLSINATQDDVRQASGDFLRAGKLVVTNQSFELDMAEEQFFADGISAPGLSYYSAADSLTVTQGGNDITVTEVNGAGSLVFDGSQAGKAVLISDSLDRGISAVSSGSAVQLSQANDIDGEIQITTAGQYTETAVTQGDGSIDLAALTGARDLTLKAPGDINIDAGTQLSGALNVDSGHTVRLKANSNNTISLGGNVTIEADAQVRVRSGVRLKSNGGDIALTATGAASRSGEGVRILGNTSAADLSEATAIITSGAGEITIDGKGGSVSANTNAGVRIGSEDAGDFNSVLLETAGGDLNITGTGGLWNADNETGLTQVAGVDLRSGTYRTTAGGAITVNGTGPTGLAAPANTRYGDRDGVTIENEVLITSYVNDDAGLATDYGAISITGTAYGTGEGIDGNDDTTAKTIRAGKGGVTLSGTLTDQPNGGSAEGSYGVVLRQFDIDAKGGAISLTGEGGPLGGDGLRAYENSTLGSSQTTGLTITGLAQDDLGDGVDLDRTAITTSGALMVTGTAVAGQGIEISDDGGGSGSTTIAAGDITLQGRSADSKGLKILRMDGATATGALTLKAESSTGDRAIDIRDSDFSAASATFGGIDTPYAAARDEGIFFDDSRLITSGAISLNGKVTDNNGAAGILLDWDKNAIDSKVLVKGQSISLDGQSSVSAPGIRFSQKIELETTGGPVSVVATSASGTPAVNVRNLSVKTAGGDLEVSGKTHLPGSLTIDTTGSGTDGTVTFKDAVDGAGSMVVDAGGAPVSFEDDFLADLLTLSNASHVQLAGNLQVSRVVTAAQDYSISMLGADNRFSLPTNFHNTGITTLGDSASDVFLFDGGMKVAGTSNPVTLHGTLRASANGGSSPGEDLDLLGAAVTLAGASTLDLTNDGNTTPGPEDDILIGSLVGSGSDYAKDLTMVAGGGDIVVNIVDDATKVGDVTVTSARNVAFNNISTIGRFTQGTGTGATSFSGSPSFAATSGAPAFDFVGHQLFFTTGGPQAGESDVLIDAVDVQIAGAMDAKGLSLQATNSPFLGNAPHAVDRLAASLSGNGAFLGFIADGALTVGTVGGVDGVSTNDGAVTLQADTLDLDKGVDAGAGTVTLRPGTVDRAVALGNETGGDRLELSQAELNRITAGKLVIGSDNTGDITVNAPDTGPSSAAVGDWVLSGLSLAQGNNGALGFSGGLRLDVDGPVSLGTNANDVDALAGSVGLLSFKDADGLAITSVDGIDGVTAKGTVTLEANTLSINEAIDTTSAPNAMTADITLAGSTDLGVDLETAGANITLGAIGAASSLSGGVRTISTGSGGGDITLDGTLDGAETLTLKAGTGDVALAGDVGGTTALTSLNVVDGNDLALSGVTTAGTQIYTQSGIITLGGTLTTAGSGITLNRPIELSGAAGIDTTDGGASASGAAINIPKPISTKTGESSSFLVDVGTSNLALNAVTTTGTQHYTAQAITLAGDLSTAGAGVTFQGPVGFDGIGAIDTTASGTVQSGGDVLFHDAATGSADIAISAPGRRVQLFDVTADSIDVTADTIDLHGETYVANTGDIALRGGIELGSVSATTSIDSSGAGGDIILAAVDDSDNATTLRLDAGSGGLTLTQAVGATAAPAGLDLRAAGINTRQPLTVHTNGDIRVENTGPALLTGVIAGSGVSLIKEGAGTLRLGSGNTFTGSTTLRDGTVAVPADSALGSVPSVVTNGHLTLDGGSLSVTSGFTLSVNRGLKVDNGGGGISVPDGESLFYNGNLRGAGALTKNGPGVLRLTGNSTNSGPVTISAGSVEVAPRDNRFRPLGSGAVTNNSDLFLDFDTNAAFTQPLSGNGTLRIRYTGTGDALFLSDATHSGGTEITGGVTLGNGTGRGDLGSGEIALKTANSQLTFQVSTIGETVFANRITGPGSLRKKGNDRITLTGNNDYQGTTTISAGRLQIGDGGTSGLPGQGTVSLDGGNLIFDRSGDITLANRLEGSQHLVHRGPDTITLTGRAAYTGRTHTPGGGSIVFRHDELPETSAFRASGQITLEPVATDFNGAQVIDYVFERSIAGFTVGKPGAGSDLAVASGIDITGPISLHGGSVAINAPIDTNGNALALHAGGAVTQTMAIAADTLALHGNASFNLTHAQNDISILAGGAVGDELASVGYTNAGALTIGNVNPAGLHATDEVRIETLSGDLTISEDIATTSNSDEAIVLNAGRSADAGDASGGNLILQGAPSISAGAQGIIRLFSGSIDGSTGIAESSDGAGDGLIGFGSGRFRYGSDEQDQAFQLALSAGTPSAIYREQPSLGGVMADQALTYGETPAAVTVTQLTGLKNGDGFVGSVANQTTSTGGYLNIGEYQAVASGPAARGYDVSNITKGEVVVSPRALDVINVSAPSRVYNGVTEAPLTGGELGAGVLGGDLVTLDTRGATGTFADPNAAEDVAVMASGYTLAGNDAANYVLQQPAGLQGEIRPRALTIAAVDRVKTVGEVLDLGSTAIRLEEGELPSSERITAATLSSVSGAAANPDAAAGSYPDDVSISNAMGQEGFMVTNYAITYQFGDLLINPAPLDPGPKRRGDVNARGIVGRTIARALTMVERMHVRGVAAEVNSTQGETISYRVLVPNLEVPESLQLCGQPDDIDFCAGDDFARGRVD